MGKQVNDLTVYLPQPVTLKAHIMKTRHTASFTRFTTVRGQRLPLINNTLHRVLNQNTETTDLLAALAAGNSFQLTERATLDLQDLLQNNIFDCEADFSPEDEYNSEEMNEGFELDNFDSCGVTVRTVQDILHDLDELAAEPSAEELIAAYYSKPLLRPKAL